MCVCARARARVCVCARARARVLVLRVLVHLLEYSLLVHLRVRVLRVLVLTA